MQRLEVSSVVRTLEWSLGVKGLISPFDICQWKPKQGTPPFASRTWASIYIQYQINYEINPLTSAYG